LPVSQNNSHFSAVKIEFEHKLMHVVQADFL
jgi:hypothetical protein